MNDFLDFCHYHKILQFFFKLLCAVCCTNMGMHYFSPLHVQGQCCEPKLSIYLNFAWHFLVSKCNQWVQAKSKNAVNENKVLSTKLPIETVAIVTNSVRTNNADF